MGTSNTPPQYLKERLTGGEDWFEVVVYIRWDREKLDALADHLDRIKEGVIDGQHDGWVQSLPGSRGLWKVEPHGCRLGEGGKGPVMRWMLSRDGIVFGFTKRYAPHETLPSGFVRMTGETLIALGDARALWAKVVEWVSELGGEIEIAKPSRIDMCVDLPNVKVSELVEAYRDEHYCTRVKRSNGFREVEHRAGKKKVTGVSMGVGTQLRIYDKLAECQDLAKRAWLAKRRWGGSVPEHATRVEFQLRREFLTAFKCKPVGGKLSRPAIDTVDDYFRFRPQIAAYLTQQWVRFTTEPPNTKHQESTPTHPVWARVIEDFQAWTGRTKPMKFDPITRREVSVDDLMKQVRGCFESAAARTGVAIDSTDDLYYFALEEFGHVLEEDAEECSDRVDKKRKAIIAPVPELAVAPF